MTAEQEIVDYMSEQIALEMDRQMLGALNRYAAIINIILPLNYRMVIKIPGQYCEAIQGTQIATTIYNEIEAMLDDTRSLWRRSGLQHDINNYANGQGSDNLRSFVRDVRALVESNLPDLNDV